MFINVYLTLVTSKYPCVYVILTRIWGTNKKKKKWWVTDQFFNCKISFLMQKLHIFFFSECVNAKLQWMEELFSYSTVKSFTPRFTPLNLRCFHFSASHVDVSFYCPHQTKKSMYASFQVWNTSHRLLSKLYSRQAYSLLFLFFFYPFPNGFPWDLPIVSHSSVKGL